jgi:hypothetical protein
MNSHGSCVGLRSGLHADLTQLAARQESAIEGAPAGSQIVLSKVRRDSQGSLPKTASNTYLDENATEL